MNSTFDFKKIITLIVVLVLMFYIYSCKLLFPEEEVDCDGEASPRIAFLRDRDTDNGIYGDNDIWIMDKNGCNQTQLTDGLDVWDFTFSPDGERICFIAGENNVSDIYIMNSDGSDIQNLTNDDNNHRLPLFTPDGSRLIFSSELDYYNTDIMIMDVDGANKINLTNSDSIPDFDATITPDGSKLIYISAHPTSSEVSAMFIMGVDGTNKECITCGLNDISLPSFPTIQSDNGKIVFRNGTRMIDTIEMNGNMHKNIVNYDVFKFVWNPQISPDDEYILYEISSGVHPNGVSIQNIYSIFIDGSNERNLTDFIGSAYGPDISEDGNHIVFGSFRDKIAKIYSMNKDGSNKTDLSNGSKPKFQPIP